MADEKKHTRAEYEYDKSLNKPGRVGSFAEWKKERKIADRESAGPSTKRVTTVRQDVRLPGATLLIAIGLFVLWLAVTGKLDQLWTGVAVAQGKVQVPAQGQGQDASAGGGGSGFAALDPSTYHMENMLFALQPSVAISHPGGLS